MKLKKLLEFFAAVGKPGYRKNVKIYENPSSIEIVKASKEIPEATEAVRFIADIKYKKVYVFHYSLLHSLAAEALDIKFPGLNYIAGIGDVKKGKILVVRFSRSDDYAKTKKNQKWLSKYFDLSRVLK